MSRINVLTAIRDHDERGAGPFLEALGFEGPGDEVLVERGKRYDARALLAYAHGKATGDCLGPDQIPFGFQKVLTDLGFTVASLEELSRPKAAASRARSSATGGTRVSKSTGTVAKTSRSRPEPIVRLCPSCFTQLSVTGSCDFCE